MDKSSDEYKIPERKVEENPVPSSFAVPASYYNKTYCKGCGYLKESKCVIGNSVHLKDVDAGIFVYGKCDNWIEVEGFNIEKKGW